MVYIEKNDKQYSALDYYIGEQLVLVNGIAGEEYGIHTGWGRADGASYRCFASWGA